MKLYTNKIELSKEQLQIIINALDHEADRIAEQLQNFLNETEEQDRTAEQTKFIERKNAQHSQANYIGTAFKVVLANLNSNFINIDNFSIEYITDSHKAETEE